MQIQGISNTFYFYDSKGNLEKEIQKDIQNELVKTTVYKRNVANDTYEKVIQEGDGSTSDFTKEYYEKGLKIKSETKNEDTTFSVEYSYDSNRNISKQIYDDGSTIEYGYEYDKKNNEPDCQMKEKIAMLRKICEAVGVNIDDLFPPL